VHNSSALSHGTEQVWPSPTSAPGAEIGPAGLACSPFLMSGRWRAAKVCQMVHRWFAGPSWRSRKRHAAATCSRTHETSGCRAWAPAYRREETARALIVVIWKPLPISFSRSHLAAHPLRKPRNALPNCTRWISNPIGLARLFLSGIRITGFVKAAEADLRHRRHDRFGSW